MYRSRVLIMAAGRSHASDEVDEREVLLFVLFVLLVLLVSFKFKDTSFLSLSLKHNHRNLSGCVSHDGRVFGGKCTCARRCRGRLASAEGGATTEIKGEREGEGEGEPDPVLDSVTPVTLPVTLPNMAVDEIDVDWLTCAPVPVSEEEEEPSRRHVTTGARHPPKHVRVTAP